MTSNDYFELRKLIMEWMNDPSDYDEKNWDEIKNIIYKLGQSNQEWISIEDRLPSVNKTVLIYDPLHDDLFSVAKMHIDENKNFQFCDYDGKPYLGITHWMPLPHPPKKST